MKPLALHLLLMCAALVPLPKGHQPRDEWAEEEVVGYVVHMNPSRWAWGAVKEFSYYDNHPRLGIFTQCRPLVFADEATYKRAETLQDQRAKLRMIQVGRGHSKWWLVESIAEDR